MKKLLVIGIIVLFLCVSLVPGITSKTSYVDDTTPPETFIELNGRTIPGDNYTFISPVEINITAVDDYGMGGIYYILNGKEEIVPGDFVKFIVIGLLDYSLEYWGVDASGNEEIPHHIIEFLIVTDDPDQFLLITEPQPGLYLFGNRVMDLDSVFIIGAFSIAVEAWDREYGIKNVEFYIDDTLIGTASTPPYGAFCAIRHFGKVKIKVVSFNEGGYSSETSREIYYYKFL